VKALTICQPPTIVSLAIDGFGHWLAGFADGEGCFYVTCSTGGSHRCQFRIKLRRDDKPILEECARRTGLGHIVDVKPPKGQKHGQAEWIVIRKAHCARLVEIFDAFPLRAKKARDYAIWKRAVELITDVRHVIDGRKLRFGEGSLRHAYQSKLAALKTALSDVRRMP
jgi:hypothetical protein